MNFGARLLRIFFPSDEAQRMELRNRMSLANAHADDLGRTIRLDVEAIRAEMVRRRAGNDPQNIVQFETLAPICKDKGPTIAGVQMCSHEKAGSGQRCEHHTCPVIVGRTQEAAREVA